MPNMVSDVGLWHHYGSHDLTEESDIKASIAALNFIISSAAKYSVDSESLSHELQQLGLPKGDHIILYSHTHTGSGDIYCYTFWTLLHFVYCFYGFVSHVIISANEI